MFWFLKGLESQVDPWKPAADVGPSVPRSLSEGRGVGWWVVWFMICVSHERHGSEKPPNKKAAPKEATLRLWVMNNWILLPTSWNIAWFFFKPQRSAESRRRRWIKGNTLRWSIREICKSSALWLWRKRGIIRVRGACATYHSTQEIQFIFSPWTKQNFWLEILWQVTH